VVAGPRRSRWSLRLRVKEHLYMKSIVIGGVGAVLVLWLGYSLGYHHGLREERRAWEATE
jgi:hypothetical protein